MPSYEYRCEKCGHCKKFSQSIHKKLPQKCPRCRSKKYHPQYGVPILWNYEVKTFGQQSELNEKRLGKEQVQLLAGEKPKAEIPWWRDDEKIMDPTTIKNPKRWIETGEDD